MPGAESPAPRDQKLIAKEFPISPGDTVSLEINELRDRFVPYQANLQVSNTGFVNIPELGRVEVEGLTALEMEDHVARMLEEAGILNSPQVMVNPVFLQKGTYSIFGVGVSASNNAPLRAGTFPIRRPDLRILEAINQVGGLNEFVTDVYVFRSFEVDRNDGTGNAGPMSAAGPASPPRQAPSADQNMTTMGGTQESGLSDEEAALIEAVERDANPAMPHSPDDSTGNSGVDTSSPYIFRDGEFVRNPDYEGEDFAPRLEPAPPTLEAPSPTVNWARIAGDTDYRVLRIAADQLRNGDPGANIYIRAGDVIRIVSGEIGVYYVMGQVNRVGPFSFNAEQVTLKAAIAAAGGLSSLAWPDRCTIYRRNGMREMMIQVNLDRVFAGKDPDLEVRRGDIINVGTHPFAPFLQRIREFTLPNPVSTVGYSFTYARNFADIDSFAVQQNPQNQPDTLPSLFQ